MAGGTLLRLVGVRAAGLSAATTAGTQLALGERADVWRDAEGAMDQITRRFGAGALRPGSLVKPGRTGHPVPEATFSRDRDHAGRDEAGSRQRPGP
jgi:DNA polymerase-4